MIRSLQAGRAIAALAVVVDHAAASTAAFSVGMPEWLRMVCGRGYLGVDFFFVLSGFIIAHTRNHHSSLGDYARSRLVRVFVPYWPVGLAMAFAFTLLPDLSAGDRPWTWLATVSLLPATGNTALNVAWTLQFELLFYAVFAIALAARRPLGGIVLWGALALAFNALPGGSPTILRPFLDLIVVEFMIGVLAAEFVASDRLQNAMFFALVTLALYFALGAIEPHRVIFGLAMGFGIVAVVRAELAGRLRVPGFLVFLGGASYSIYLVHNPVASLAVRLVDDWRVAFAATAVAGIALGILYYFVVEKPALRLFSRRRNRPAENVPPAAGLTRP